MIHPNEPSLKELKEIRHQDLTDAQCHALEVQIARHIDHAAKIAKFTKS